MLSKVAFVVLILIALAFVSSGQHPLGPICMNKICNCRLGPNAWYYISCMFLSNSSELLSLSLPDERQASTITSHLIVTLEIYSDHHMSSSEIPKGFFASLNIETIIMANLGLASVNGKWFKNINPAGLYELDLRKNKIADIDFDDFPIELSKRLKVLNLQENLLKTMPNFNSLINLTLLYLSFNRIRAIEMDKLEQLKDLDLLDSSDNLIEGEIDFARAPANLRNSLRELKLDNNSIKSVKNIGFLRNLSKISIRSNKITEITRAFIGHLSNLNELDLSQNKIRFIDKYAFRNLTKLQYLDMSHNELKTFDTFIANGLCDLTILDLKHNHIEYLDFAFIRELKMLENLDLSNNKIRQITFASVKTHLITQPPLLRVLRLSGNKLEDISFPKLLNLEKLYLNGNYLKMHPTVYLLPQLDLLDISEQNGRLTHIQTDSGFNRISPTLFTYKISANANLTLCDNVFCTSKNAYAAKHKSFQMDLYISNTTVLNMKPCVFKRFASIYDRVRLFILNDSVEKPTHDFSLVCDCKFRMYLSRFNVLIKDVCPRYGTYCEPMTYHEICKDNEKLECD